MRDASYEILFSKSQPTINQHLSLW